MVSAGRRTDRVTVPRDVRKDSVVHLVHVHVCATGHPDIEDILSFRDYLRSHPDVATCYGNLKTKLACEFAHDNVGYMLGKDAFVKNVLEKSLGFGRTANK